ncbi:translation elongation factor Ts [Spiroplasma endosymbiont of 'Nebria riversi']|uniref:translation elongation factor Ts n=1 Tax=Spiroplasma endosymbiont of 'Nebria riversi' TaxID=2792084 RepID=UPI001C05BEB0|nr:translation elongation factor Ts [Spiroplasma endosymbiont of 'Nebria riversi']
MPITMEMIKNLRDRTSVGLMDCKKALEASNGNIEAAIQWLRTNGIAKAQAKQARINTEGLSKVLVVDDIAIILELNCETDFVAKNKLFLELLDNILTLFLKHQPLTLEAGFLLKNEENIVVNDLLNEATYKLGEKISIRRFTIITKSDQDTLVGYNYGNYRIASLVKLQGQVDNDIAKKLAMHVVASKPAFISREDIPQDFINKEMDIINSQMATENKPPEILEKIKQGRLDKQLAEYSLLDQPFMFDEKKKVQEILIMHNTKVLLMYRYEVGEGITKND